METSPAAKREEKRMFSQANEKWKSVNGAWTINPKELSEVEWMNGDFFI